MRKFIITLNIIQFIWMSIILLEQGFPEKTGDLSFIILLLLLPFINIFIILKTNNTSKGWISLFFERKQLEEKAKIDKLRNQK